MKYAVNELSTTMRILLYVIEFVIFSAIWMLVGPKVIDISSNWFVEIFDFGMPYLSWLLYGILIFIGCNIIYLGCRKAITLVKSKHD